MLLISFPPIQNKKFEKRASTDPESISTMKASIKPPWSSLGVKLSGIHDEVSTETSKMKIIYKYKCFIFWKDIPKCKCFDLKSILKSLTEYPPEWPVSTKTHYGDLVGQLANSTAVVGTELATKIHCHSIPALVFPCCLASATLGYLTGAGWLRSFITKDQSEPLIF